MKSIRRTAAEVFEIPVEAASNRAVITIVGNEKIIIENAKGVIKYEETMLKINTAEVVTEIVGKNIEIKTMGDKSIIAEGIFDGVRFINY